MAQFYLFVFIVLFYFSPSCASTGDFQEDKIEYVSPIPKDITLLEDNDESSMDSTGNEFSIEGTIKSKNTSAGLNLRSLISKEESVIQKL